MIWLIRAIHGCINFILTPLNGLSYAWGIVLCSAFTGIVMLLIFRATSNQAQIKRVKDIIKAYILEIRLYKDSPRIIMSAFGHILVKNLVYLRYAFVPLLIVIIPVSLILMQLHFRYEYRGFRPHEAVLVKAFLKAEAAQDIHLVSLTASDGLEVETPPLHIEKYNEVDWRIRVRKQGVHFLTVHGRDMDVVKSLNAVERLLPLSPKRVSPVWSAVLFNPGEQPLPPQSPFSSVEIVYPQRVNILLGVQLNWLVAFFILSLIFALVLKGPMKVEV